MSGPAPPANQDDARYRKVVWAWCLYDWANSAFATTVMAALFPPYFRWLAESAGLGPGRATAYWGYTVAGALFLVAVLAPLLGAIADHARMKKLFAAFFMGLGVASTAAFVFIGPGQWRLAALLYIGGNVGFAGANIFYESLLPFVARTGDADRVSARGYALGYVGGGLLLAVHLVMVLYWSALGFPSRVFAMKTAFFSVAVWWALFSIPFFRQVAEPPLKSAYRSYGHLVIQGFARVRGTFSEIRRYRQLLIFLAAFWLYNDGIGTIIKMATAYGDEIGIGIPQMMGALVITQFVGIPATLAFGALARRFSAKNMVLGGLFVYSMISVGGYFMTHAWHFFLLASVVGLVQGGCQALSRSLFSDMVPKDKAAEFFGFFSTSNKMAGIAGPLVFGVVSQVTGGSRVSIVSLVFFFLVGAALLSRVNVSEGALAAGRIPPN